MKTLCLLCMICTILGHVPCQLHAQGHDSGDLPDLPYATLNSNNGARHIVGALFLGSRVDGEVDGQPNMTAMGDDFSGGIDDEDGVQFVNWLIPGATAMVNLTASGTGFLNAWIDFNKNGQFTDPGEQIFSNVVLPAGTVSKTFAVPSSTMTHIRTYARFRFSSAQNLTPGGIAVDGEVEDYRVYIGIPAPGNGIMDPDPGLCHTQNEVSMTYERISKKIFAAYNDNPFPGGLNIGVSWSSDKGATWTPWQLNMPMNTIAVPNIPMLEAFDPTIACDDSGHVFVAHIATDNNWGSGPVTGLFVHKTTNGGATWHSPTTVSIKPGANGTGDPAYRLNDRCQIIVDRHAGSPYHNHIYIAWIMDRGWFMPSPDSDVYTSFSWDGGTHFTTPVQINSMANSMGNMPIPTVASDGTVYVLWMNYNVQTGGTGTLYLDKSTDGGLNWGNDKMIMNINLPPLNLNNYNDVRAKGAAIIRTHPTNPNKLYIVYAADQDPTDADEADIFFIRSSDGGSSWSSPLRINDDSTTCDQVLPWMEVTANGTIDMVWYDRREDPSDWTWNVYATFSTDSGSTFATNFKLNQMNFASPQTPVGSWFGEYLGLTVTDTFAFVGFTTSAVDDQGDVLFASFSHPGLSAIPDEDPGVMTLSVFPNPTQDGFMLEGNCLGDAWIQVTDFTGRQVLGVQSQGNSQYIDLSECSGGVYLVRVSIDSGALMRKVVKY